MCDTMVVRPGFTKSGALLFAKNSDREANEAQYLQHVPRARHDAGSRLQCTYIAIPQVAETHAVLLSRPFWMWGAEMGANEHGLVIGNEAVFSKIAPQKEAALIGMDLLRLGLERAASAQEAVHVITDLLAAHGQGGNCAHLGHFEYHNSFLIADATGEAFVLETVGRDWVTERVTDRRSISNTYMIGKSFETASQGLMPLALERGFVRQDEPLDFADAFANRHRSNFATGSARWCRTSELIAARPKQDASGMMRVLRDHGPKAAREPDWRPDGVMGGSVCAHASWGPIRRFGQTTASWVAELGAGRAVHWLTGTSSPDTSIFKPVFFGPGWEGAGLPDFGPVPTDSFDASTLWWSHERLHRAVLEDYGPRMAAFASKRDRLEASFIERVDALIARGGSAEDAGALSRAIWKEAAEAERGWLADVLAIRPRATKRPSHLYRMHWQKLARLARLPA
ncbi:MAG: carcinine hydrolase/isopenicillin-N N-acyltransferase family protein [Parvibaculum sp.]